MRYLQLAFGTLLAGFLAATAVAGPSINTQTQTNTSPQLAGHGFPNGRIVRDHTHCASGHSAAGPGGVQWCLAAALNCPQPFENGVVFGTSYVFEGVQYFCVAGRGTTTQPAPRTFEDAVSQKGAQFIEEIDPMDVLKLIGG